VEGHQAQLIREKRRTFIVAMLLIVAGGVAFIALPSDEPDPREGSRVVEGNVSVSSGPLASYAVSYLVETHSEAGTALSREEILVERPFNARVVSGDVETIGAFGRYRVRGQSFYVPPAAPEADGRPAVVAAEAVEDGYAEVRETREVLGRRCAVYRFGRGTDPLSLSPLERAEAYTDVCIGEDGLVLEEVDLEGKDIVRRRIARKIDDSPRIDPELFDVPEPAGNAQQVGSVMELTDDSRLPGGRFWQLPKEPDGFELMGRYAVVPPAQPGFTDITARGNVISFLSMVYTDGADVLVIDQGSTQGSVPFAEDPGAKDIRAGDLGKGELRYSLRESEVRFLTGGVRFVRIRGTLPPSRLLDVAGSLEAVEGGPLVQKDH
jgi:hypothetical protein